MNYLFIEERNKHNLGSKVISKMERFFHKVGNFIFKSPDVALSLEKVSRMLSDRASVDSSDG